MGDKHITIRNTHLIGEACREQFLPLDSTAGETLKRLDISLAGISTLRGSYEIGRVNPNWHVLIYTLSGRGQLTTEETTTSITPGTVLFLPRFTSHAYRLLSSTWKIIWFHLRPMETWSYLETRSWSLDKARHLNAISAAVQGLLDESQYVDEDSRQAATFYAQLIALNLHRELSFTHSSSAWRLREQLRELWSAVHADLATDWSVPALARRMHSSSGHFHRIVNQVYGKGPMEKLTEIRMQRAASLLRSGDLPAYQIAAQVGYSNPFAFSTAFKRYHGRSPQAYRRET